MEVSEGKEAEISSELDVSKIECDKQNTGKATSLEYEDIPSNTVFEDELQMPEVQGGPLAHDDPAKIRKKNPIDASRVSMFIRPTETSGTSTSKLRFLANHPIQPDPKRHTLPFDAAKIYHRVQPDGEIIQKK